MRIKIFLFLVFLFLSTLVYAQDDKGDLVVNGFIGKVIPDATILDTAFYKPSKIGIPDVIMKGRAIIDAHRRRKVDSYKIEMEHKDRVATNVDRLMDMRAKLQGLGFKNEGDLIKQSRLADIKTKIKEVW